MKYPVFRVAVLILNVIAILRPGQARLLQSSQVEYGLYCQTAVLQECIFRLLNIAVRFDELFLSQQKGAPEYTEKLD